MTEFPNSWAVVTGEDLFSSIRGVSYNKSEASGLPRHGLVPILRANNISEGQIVPDDLVYVPSRYVSSEQYLKDGDLLIAASSGSRSVVGKAARANKSHERFGFGAFCAVARPRSSELSPWLASYMSSRAYRDYVERVALGININNFRGSDLKAMPIQMAPIAEQRRIVAKIDSLSAKSKRARDHLDHIPRLVEKYEQTILAAAFSGELTRKWRTSPRPMIAAQTSDGATTPHKPRRRSTDGFTNRIGIDFTELPQEWNYRAIGQLLDERAIIDFADGNHGSEYPRKQEFGDDGAVFITAAQIRNGRIHFDECSLLNLEKAKTLRKGWAHTGDVLLTHNATVGRVAIVNDAVDPFLLGTSVTYYRTNPSLLSNRYLYWLFRSPIFQDQLKAIMGQTTRNQVPITRQAYIEIPIAPVTEQQEIVRRIDMALGWIDRLASETTNARKLIDHLDQAILAKAFRGELVPQDPNDEPASVMLERIRAERDVAPVGVKAAAAPRTRRRAKRRH